MALLAKIPFLSRPSRPADEEIRDVAQILEMDRLPRRAENLRFTLKTRGKSPASLFGRDQLREAILHCVVTDDSPRC